MKHMVLTLALLAFGTASASAQSAWAEKLFGGVTSHDFGGVPHGAQVKYSFPVKNIYAVDLTFTQVRSSCGCLTPVANPLMLKPQQTGTIDITIDTTRFTGFKSFKVHVTVGPQFVSTATLSVSATSRTDVVFNPGQINFGVVPQGKSPAQIVDVEYAGALNWQMVEVVKNSAAPFTVTAKELYRQLPQNGVPGKVGYRLTATLKPDAPAGAIKQELVLKTNDPTTPVLTLLAEGTVQATLTVAPSNVNYGAVKVGETKILRVQVRGARPFRILGVNGDGTGVKVEVPTASAASHLLTIHLAPTQAGEVRRQLEIRTDLDNAILTLPVEATVTQ